MTKKLLFFFITLTTFTNVSYASFPIADTLEIKQDISLENKVENNAAISSLGLSIIASAIVKHVLNVQFYSFSTAIIIAGLAISSFVLSYKGMKSKKFRKLAGLSRLFSSFS